MAKTLSEKNKFAQRSVYTYTGHLTPGVKSDKPDFLHACATSNEQQTMCLGKYRNYLGWGYVANSSRGLGVGDICGCVQITARLLYVHPPHAQWLHREQSPRTEAVLVDSLECIYSRGLGDINTAAVGFAARIPESKRGLTEKSCCCWEQGSSANFSCTGECLPSLGGGRATAHFRAWTEEKPTDLMSLYENARVRCEVRRGATCLSQLWSNEKRETKRGVSSNYEGCMKPFIFLLFSTPSRRELVYASHRLAGCTCACSSKSADQQPSGCGEDLRIYSHSDYIAHQLKI